MRDLVRARATAGRVLSKARQHLQSFVLRHDQIYRGVRAWTLAYRRWLTTIRFAHPAQPIVLQDYLHAVQDAEARLDRLTQQIEELLPNWSMGPVAMALQAMRGVALVVAVTVVAEVGDFRRFANARQLMAYLGLVPSDHSSGPSFARGGIPKAGNALARRVVIEGAWTYRRKARVSRKLHDRLEPLSAAIRDIAWKAQVRLCARYRRLAAAGKPKVVVTLAIAREMIGFIWAIASHRAAGSWLIELPTKWTGGWETEGNRSNGAHCRRQDHGGESSWPVMSRSPDRRSSLERGSPETKPRSCGNQPAHESLFNRRLRVLSPAVRTYEPTPSAAAEPNNCVRTLEGEHESRMRKKSVL